MVSFLETTNTNSYIRNETTEPVNVISSPHPYQERLETFTYAWDAQELPRLPQGTINSTALYHNTAPKEQDLKDTPDNITLVHSIGENGDLVLTHLLQRVEDNPTQIQEPIVSEKYLGTQ